MDNEDWSNLIIVIIMMLGLVTFFGIIFGLALTIFLIKVWVICIVAGLVGITLTYLESFAVLIALIMILSVIKKLVRK